MTDHQLKILVITGWKNSGKTTLVERLTSHFTKMGLNIATIKHAHHNFDIDKEGTDSFRHRAAGARQTILTSSKRMAIMVEREQDDDEHSIDDLIAKLDPCDLIIIEGYKKSGFPKIVCHDPMSNKSPLYHELDNVIAVACDNDVINYSGIVFQRDKIEDIGHFVLNTLEVHI